MRSPGAALLLAEPESGDLVEYVFDADDPERVTVITAKSGEGVLGAAMLAREAIRILQLRADSRYSPRIEGAFPFQASSALAVALEG